jgi:surface protein
VYSLSLAVATPSVVVVLNTTTRVLSDHNSHPFCCFVLWFETVLFVVVGGGLVFFLSLLHPLLAVFANAHAFNQDVSKWSTGAVTTMHGSKCTLSPSLWPRLLLLWF